MHANLPQTPITYSSYPKHAQILFHWLCQKSPDAPQKCCKCLMNAKCTAILLLLLITMYLKYSPKFLSNWEYNYFREKKLSKCII